MQRSPHLFMRLMFHVQCFNERNTHVKGVRSFSLLPHTNGFTAKYIVRFANQVRITRDKQMRYFLLIIPGKTAKR